MIEPFCKLFDTAEYGQILLLLNRPDGAGGVELFFTAGTAGVCAMAMTFGEKPYTEPALRRAKHYFDIVDEHEVLELVRTAVLGLQEMKDSGETLQPH